jgi:predicted chitinase
MPYKVLTKMGEEFIGKAVAMNANNFTGSNSYALGRSNVAANTTVTSNAKYKGSTIGDNATLTTALIDWLNTYCSDYDIDTNIIAAQLYIESQYNLWNFSKPDGVNATSNMGITQLSDTEIYDLFFSNNRKAAQPPKDLTVFTDQANLLATGLNIGGANITTGDTVDIRYIVPYRSDSDKDTDAIAISNRSILFQNIIDNPEIIIKNFCRFMAEIGGRNVNLAASAMLSYVTDPYLESISYNDAIAKAAKSSFSITLSTKYVDNVFKVLGGVYTSKLNSFGKDYVYDTTKNDQANQNLSNALLAGQSTTPNPYNTLTGLPYPVNTIKLIVKSLNKFGITNPYMQTGVCAVISTEGGFYPKSEYSYSKTPNDRLRAIFGLRLADLSESQLTSLKGFDSLFFDKVYGGQYGNTTAGDGYNYRGRGFNQITFKAIYQSVSDKIGTNVVNTPDLLNRVDVAADAVAAYFSDNFAIGKSSGILANKFGVNDVNNVENYTLGTQIAFQANAGWKKNTNIFVLQEELSKQLKNATELYKIVQQVS